MQDPMGNPRFRVAEAAVDGRKVVVDWADSHQSRFHATWLRDNCSCEACGQTTSAIRRVRLTEIPVDIAARSVRVLPDGQLEVEWANDGHKTLLDPLWLRTHCYSSHERARRRFKPILWGPELADDLPAADYERVRADEECQLEMLTMLRDYGFVLLRGAPAEAAATEDVTAFVGLLRITSWGKIYELISRPTPVILGDTGKGLDPHTDEPYRHLPPGITFFHCLAASDDGGASLLVDSFRIAEALRASEPEAFELLSHVPQPFHRVIGQDREFRTAGRIFSLDFEGNVVGFRLLDRGTAPLDLPEDLIEPYYIALRKLLSVIYDPQQQFRLRLVAGDVLMFNNQRVMHGRTAFDATKATRHMRSCHVDLDEFYSQLRLLCRRLGRDEEAEMNLPAGAAA
jgi:gamma-butyrobetaine dioxygenase